MITVRRDEDTAIEQVSDDLVLVTAQGRQFLVTAACPHRNGRLAHGYVNGRMLRITCPLHRSTFDLLTGCPLSGPAAAPLAVQEITESGSAEEGSCPG